MKIVTWNVNGLSALAKGLQSGDRVGVGGSASIVSVPAPGVGAVSTSAVHSSGGGTTQSTESDSKSCEGADLGSEKLTCRVGGISVGSASISSCPPVPERSQQVISADPDPNRSLSSALARFLDSLDADIICFQETKLSRARLLANPHLAFVDGYEAFFSFCRVRDAYSGVVTYCRKPPLGSEGIADVSKGFPIPFASEDGFSGVAASLRSVGGAVRDGAAGKAGLVAMAEDSVIGGTGALVSSGEFDSSELRSLENEGRCVTTDHGQFVLFNVYFPNASDEAASTVWDGSRMDFKLRFQRAFELRVSGLLARGRHVVVVGDFNVCHGAIDYALPPKPLTANRSGLASSAAASSVTDEEGTDDSPARAWFDSFLVNGGGRFVDVFRLLHPTRTGAYTCWNTKLRWRESNIGSRIDYILADTGLAFATALPPAARPCCCASSLSPFSCVAASSACSSSLLISSCVANATCCSSPSLSSSSSLRFAPLQQPLASDDSFCASTASFTNDRHCAFSVCDILPDVLGSDHCPVTATLAEAALESLMKSVPAPYLALASDLRRPLPPLAARCMPEFSGTQRSLRSFFPKQLPKQQPSGGAGDLSLSVQQGQTFAAANVCGASFSLKGRPDDVPIVKRSRTDKKLSLTKISTFFASNCTKASRSSDAQPHLQASSVQCPSEPCVSPIPTTAAETLLASRPPDSGGGGGVVLKDSAVRQTEQWKALLSGRPPIPLCTVHAKPCKLQVTKKKGANRGWSTFCACVGVFFEISTVIGRKFFSCSSAAAERCDFFQWERA